MNGRHSLLVLALLSMGLSACNDSGNAGVTTPPVAGPTP